MTERVGDEASTICKRTININKHADWRGRCARKSPPWARKPVCYCVNRRMPTWSTTGKWQLIPQDEGVDTLNKMYQNQLIQSMMANLHIPMLMQVG